MITSVRRSLFALLSLSIVAVAAVTLRSAAYARHPDVLAWAFTFDLTLTIPLLYYVLVVRGGMWTRTAARTVSPITVIPVFVVSVIAAKILIPHDQQQFLHALRYVTAPLDLVTIALVARRLARGGGTGNSVVDRVVASEVEILRYGLLGWRREDAPGFTVHKRNDWKTIVVCFIIAIAAESLGVHLLVQHWSVKAAWIITALDLYGMLWLIGDYHALRLHPTTIDDGVLHLRYGIRWSVDIPIGEIASIRRAVTDWKRKGVLKVAMLDEPSLVITLREPRIAHGLMGITRRIDAIAMLPDEPERFESALRLAGANY